MTDKPIWPEIRLLNYHFALRLLAAIVAAHIITSYGEKESFFELLILPGYYPAFAGSFVIAIVLIELVYRASDYLNSQLGPTITVINHALFQVLFVVFPISVLAYLFAALYFWARGVSILDTTYIRYDYPFIVSKIIILNSIYFYYYSHHRRFGMEKSADATVTDETVAEVMADRPTFEISKGLLIPLDEICYIYHDGHATKVYNTWGAEPLICFHSLNRIEQQIGEPIFFRINRRMIVNISFIKEVRTINRRLELVLEPVFKVGAVVSQLHTPAFKTWHNSHIAQRQ